MRKVLPWALANIIGYLLVAVVIFYFGMDIFRRIPLDNLARLIISIGLFVSIEIICAWSFFRVLGEDQLPDKLLQPFRG